MNINLILSIFQKIYLLYEIGIKYEEVVKEFNTKAETMDEETLDAWLDDYVTRSLAETQKTIDEAKAKEKEQPNT